LAGSRGRYKGRRSNEPRYHPPSESDRTPMLNVRAATSFRFGLREIMSNYKVEEGVASSVIASVIAKGSRISINSARDYVLEQEKTGLYPREVTDEILDLLDRYTRHR